MDQSSRLIQLPCPKVWMVTKTTLLVLPKLSSRVLTPDLPFFIRKWHFSRIISNCQRCAALKLTNSTEKENGKLPLSVC